MTNKVWTRAEILDLIQPTTADKETKRLFRALTEQEQIAKIRSFANLYDLKIA